MVEPVVARMELPPGAIGPEAASVDVRCFVVPHAGGIVLVDTGPPGNEAVIGAALARIGAEWSDVTDVVMTHGHFDHAAALPEVADRAFGATLWAGAADAAAIRSGDSRPVRGLVEGDRVGPLSVLHTPGHTPGHISLLHERTALLLIGDVLGSVEGALSFGPPAFTVDKVLSRQSLARLATLPIDRFLFSHGAEVADPLTAIREILRVP